MNLLRSILEKSNVAKAIKRPPHRRLAHLVASFVLAAIPVLLWVSAPSSSVPGKNPAGLVVPNVIVFDLDPFYLFSLSLIGLLTVVMIGIEAARAAFSLHLAHWIFVYVFFFTTPLVQYRIGTFPWGKLTSLDRDTLLYTNLAILLWCVAWIVTRIAQTRGLLHLPTVIGPRASQAGVWLSAVLAAFATAYLISWLGPLALLSRAEDYTASQNISSVDLLVEKLFRVFPVAATAGALWLLRKNRPPLQARLGLVFASVGLLLIADFPLGTARYLVGAVYLGLLLTLFGRRLRTGWPLVFLMVGGLLVVFPLLSTLRYVTSLQQAVFFMGSGFNFLGPSLATGDFDAYSMVGYTTEYVGEGPGITHGRQLLGVLLFFVPRSLWPDKPVGSGYTVATEGGLSFVNVSSSPIAEALINFGWTGIFLFAFVLCWIFGALDNSFTIAEHRDHDALIRLIYPFWVGIAFFLMRGDLLSSTAYIVAFTVAFLPLAVQLRRPLN